VDNLAIYYGWENRQAKKDREASILIRALHLMASYLPCRIHVQHLPRVSSVAAKLADSLSREETTSREEGARSRAVSTRLISPSLRSWLADPREDWELANQLLSDMVARLENP